MREALKRSYSCDICGNQYSQPQGLSRHHQAEHKPHSCLYCGFKWSRPYQYRIHLEKRHLDVNPDNVLGKPAGSRRKSKIIGRDLPQYVFPPAPEPDRQSQAKPLRRSLMPPLPAMLSVAYYDTRPEHAEPAVTSRKREDASVLELSDAPSMFLFTEEHVQSVTDVGISTQRRQVWLVHPFW